MRDAGTRTRVDLALHGAPTVRSHDRVKLRVRGVAALLFFSGACALVYQVAWFRELRLIFGASTASSAAVLAIFMGGLGVGGARLGKRADASANPLAMYASLELAVACAAGATPALVWLANTVYLACGGSAALGTFGATVVRVILSVVVLGPATFLMGGTLPAAARAVEREDDGPRSSVATLYGVNTFGAVCGAMLANFLLLEVLGTRLTLWMAALVNLLVGVIARGVARGAAASPAASEEAAEATLEPAPEPAVEPASGPELARWFPPAASALLGGSFMLMELTWYRMLGPLLGGSSYTFGLILAVALVGIAVGGIVYARTKVPATLRWFAVTCSLEALFIAIPYAVGDRLAVVTLMLRPLARLGFGASTAVWAAIAGFVILPAAIVSGIQFPLVIGLYGRGSAKVGRDVGAAYLANTIGSIVGSIAGGFGLIPLLGAVGSWQLVVISLSIGATVALIMDARTNRTPLFAAVVRWSVAWAPAALLLATGPTAFWRHTGIGAGRADSRVEGNNVANSMTYLAHVMARDIRWEADGLESSVALTQTSGFNFSVNGKSDGHVLVDAPTQVMSGLLAALLHGQPKTALVVGLGTGSTAGWIGAVPSIDRVDVVELEPAILRVARDAAPVNEHVLDNPKVHVHLADAREYLRTTANRYDLIFSEPSNPFRAGISSLYTVEYYTAAAQRVAPGGLFVQWVQAYEVDGWAVATAMITLHKVFADVEVWQTMTGDLLLVARTAHARLDAARLRQTLSEEPYARAARDVWNTSSLEGVLGHFVARSELADILTKNDLGAVNTDDQNFLEFAFARSVGRARRVDTELAALSRRLHTSTPDIQGDVDKPRVQEERWLFQIHSEMPLSPVPRTYPASKLGVVLQAFSDGQDGVALKAWKALERPPAKMSYGEMLVVAECAARAGGPEDVPLIDLAPLPHREVFHALYAVRHQDDPGAAQALARAFVAARTSPWLPHRHLTMALTLARDIAATNPRTARVLYDSLREPFSVEASREERLLSAAKVGSMLPDPNACVEALAPLEPPPWVRSVLELRLRCYTRTNHPYLARATKDLLDMTEVDAQLGASLPSPPRAPAPKATGSAPGPAPDAGTEAGAHPPPDPNEGADSADSGPP
jgi:spermidine synthase